MRQLLPARREDVDPYDAYRAPTGAELLRVNMVAALDGSVVDREGRSGGLGGPADREVFQALRALADGVLVGAGTARAEGYGPHRLRPDLAERRQADGRATPAALVVVSRSLELDFATPLFTEAVRPTILLTCASAPGEQRERAGQAAEVVVAGSERVDLREGIQRLRAEHGLAHLLCEGGPSLNADLFSAGLVDELCLTLAARLVGTPRRLADHLGVAVELSLEQLIEADSELLTRYRVAGRQLAHRA